MTIRSLRLSDLLRQFLLGSVEGVSLVVTREGLASGPRGVPYAELVRQLMFPRRRWRGWVQEEYQRLRVLATTRRRSGPRAWEVAHLHLAKEHASRVDELLEQSGSHAGQSGAERLFIRLPQGSPLEEGVRRSGFVPCVAETVYQGIGQASGQQMSPPAGLRPCTAGDQHSLFRLYNACTPPQARAGQGLTLEQWRDALEEVHGPCRQFVYEREGETRAWLRVSFARRTAIGEMMVHPGERDVAPALASFAGQLVRPRHRVMWLVPAYQTTLQQALTQADFVRGTDYTVLVKPVAARVKETALAPAKI